MTKQREGYEVEFSADTSKLTSGVRAVTSTGDKASRALKGVEDAAEQAARGGQDLASAAREAESAWGGLGDVIGGNLVANAVSALASAAKDAVGQVIEVGMGFESSMANVAALSGATGESLAGLESIAREYGATTQFSASQAADALGYMALAGWDVAEMADGLPGVLSLAAASGMELAQASDMVTDYLSAFGMEASQSAYFADMLAFAQANSNTTAQALGEAYRNCAANLNAAGQDVETVTSLLAMMADQGLKGSEAGTALAAVMRDVTAKMEDGAIKVGDVSVAVTDEAGNFRDLTDVLLDVEAATAGMGDAERAAALSATFTADSTKGMNLILNAGVGSARDFEDALRGCAGSAEDMAGTMTDTLQGDLLEMQSALEEVAIQAYQEFEPALRDLAQAVTDEVAPALSGGAKALAAIVDAVAAVPGPVKTAVLGLASFVLAGRKIPQVVGAVKTALAALRAQAVATSAAMGPVGLAGALAGLVLPSVISAISEQAEAMEADREAAENLERVARGLSGALDEVRASASGSLEEPAQAAQAVTDTAARARDEVRGLTSELADMYESAARDIGRAEASGALAAQYAEQAKSLAELASAEGLTEERRRDLNAAIQEYNSLTGESIPLIDETGAGLEALPAKIDAVTEAYRRQALVAAYQGALTEAQSKVIDATRVRDEARAAADAAYGAIDDAWVDYLATNPGEADRWARFVGLPEDADIDRVIEGIRERSEAGWGSLFTEKGGPADIAGLVVAYDEAERAASKADAALASAQATVDELASSMAEAAGAAEEEAEASEGSAEAAAGAAEAAAASVDAHEALAEALADAQGMALDEEEATRRVAAAMASFESGALDASDAAREVSDALERAGISSVGVTGDMLEQADAAGVTATELMRMAGEAQDAADAADELAKAQDEAEKAAEKAAEEYAESVLDIAEWASGLSAVRRRLDEAGESVSSFAERMRAAGLEASDLEGAMSSLAEFGKLHGGEMFDYDWGLNTESVTGNLRRDQKVVEDWARGIQDLWATHGGTAEDNEFIQYLQDMGVQSATLMQQWIDGVGPSYEEVRDAYLANQDALARAVVENAEAANEAAARAGGEIAGAVAEGAQEAAGGEAYSEAAVATVDSLVGGMTDALDVASEAGRMLGEAVSAAYAESLSSAELPAAATGDVTVTVVPTLANPDAVQGAVDEAAAGEHPAPATGTVTVTIGAPVANPGAVQSAVEAEASGDHQASSGGTVDVSVTARVANPGSVQGAVDDEASGEHAADSTGTVGVTVTASVTNPNSVGAAVWDVALADHRAEAAGEVDATVATTVANPGEVDETLADEAGGEHQVAATGSVTASAEIANADEFGGQVEEAVRDAAPGTVSVDVELEISGYGGSFSGGSGGRSLGKSVEALAEAVASAEAYGAEAAASFAGALGSDDALASARTAAEALRKAAEGKLAPVVEGGEFTNKGVADGGFFVAGLKTQETASGGAGKALADAATAAMDASVDAYWAGHGTGTSFTAGLAAGIASSDAVRSVASAAADAVNQARAAAEKAGQIRSPSRVAMRIGEHWAEGLAMGIENGTDGVAGAGERTMLDTIEAVSELSRSARRHGIGGGVANDSHDVSNTSVVIDGSMAGDARIIELTTEYLDRVRAYKQMGGGRRGR